MVLPHFGVVAKKITTFSALAPQPDEIRSPNWSHSMRRPHLPPGAFFFDRCIALRSGAMVEILPKSTIFRNFKIREDQCSACEWDIKNLKATAPSRFWRHFDILNQIEKILIFRGVMASAIFYPKFLENFYSFFSRNFLGNVFAS